MLRYTPSMEIPTAYAKTLKSASVVMPGVQGVTKLGYGWRGNSDTTSSGGQTKITHINQGKMDRPSFLGPQ